MNGFSGDTTWLLTGPVSEEHGEKLNRLSASGRRRAWPPACQRLRPERNCAALREFPVFTARRMFSGAAEGRERTARPATLSTHPQ
jgi:hypothetical protein